MRMSPNFVFETFGSSLTGLARPTSDIDFRILHPAHTLPRPTKLERRGLLEELHLIRRRLQKNERFTDVTLLHSRYPLVSAIDKKTGLQVQIVAASSTVGHTRDAVIKYKGVHPFLPELFPVIQAFFRSRGLAEVYTGGFGTYTIFMMIVAALRFSEKTRNAAEGLVTFFTFWSHDPTVKSSPFYRKGISIEPPVLFDKYENPVGPEQLVQRMKAGETPYLPEYMLCLKDPVDPTNDLGHKSAAIKHFRATCAEVVEAMSKVETKDIGRFLTETIVGNIHTAEKEPREKLEAYGKRLRDKSEEQLLRTIFEHRWPEAGGATPEEETLGKKTQEKETPRGKFRKIKWPRKIRSKQ